MRKFGLNMMGINLLWIPLIFIVIVTGMHAVVDVTKAQDASLPKIYVDPEKIVVVVGQTFDINIIVANVTDLYGFGLKLFWNTFPLDLMNVTIRPFLNPPTFTAINKIAQYTPVVPEPSPIPGTPGPHLGGYMLSILSLPPAQPKSGSGTLVTLTFKAVQPGGTALLLRDTRLSDSTLPEPQPIDHITVGGEVIEVIDHAIDFGGETYHVVTETNSTLVTTMTAYNTTFVDITDPLLNSSQWHEVSPSPCNTYNLTGWEDYGLTGELSSHDLVNMTHNNTGELFVGYVESVEVIPWNATFPGKVTMTFTTITPTLIAFSQPHSLLRFEISGVSETSSFCNVTVPKNFVKGEPWLLFMDGINKTYTLSENVTHSNLYFNYNFPGGESMHRVVILGVWSVPEFPTAIITSLLLIIILTAVVAWKKLVQIPSRT